MLTLEVFQSSGGCRHLQTTNLIKAILSILLDRLQLFDGIASEVGHRLGRRSLEHEAWGMGRRATRHVQWPLLDDSDIIPSSRGQLIGEIGSHNPCADDDNALVGGHCDEAIDALHEAVDKLPLCREPRSWELFSCGGGIFSPQATCHYNI